MLEIITDGRLQVTAALSLLENSKLITWNSELSHFSPVNRDTFEDAARNVDPVFGRLICWINFSAGAEFLAKGVCLVNEIEIRNKKDKKDEDVPKYPSTDIAAWIPRFLENPKCDGTEPYTNFGTLGDLYATPNGYLRQLVRAMGDDENERDLLLAAYKLLGSAIRNRDAHAYVPNVRDSHHHLVPELFSDCFNLLFSWLPNGSRTLNNWRNESEQFISEV